MHTTDLDILSALVGAPAAKRLMGSCPRLSDLVLREPSAGTYGTPAVARKLQAARELVRRALAEDLAYAPMMDSPSKVKDYASLHLSGLEHEVFAVMFLDNHHRLIEIVTMFRGTLTQTSVYPREVVKAALARNASAVILAHNHPSGLPEPSRADEYLTQTLKAALSLVDVRVLDHIIVGTGRTCSFAERGLL